MGHGFHSKLSNCWRVSREYPIKSMFLCASWPSPHVPFLDVKISSWTLHGCFDPWTGFLPGYIGDQNEIYSVPWSTYIIRKHQGVYDLWWTIMLWQQGYSSWYSSAQQYLVVSEAPSKKNTGGVERVPVLWPLSPSLSMFLLQEGAGCAWGGTLLGRHQAESGGGFRRNKISTDPNWEPTKENGESIYSNRKWFFVIISPSQMETLNVKKLETDAASPLLRDILTRIGVRATDLLWNITGKQRSWRPHQGGHWSEILHSNWALY